MHVRRYKCEPGGCAHSGRYDLQLELDGLWERGGNLGRKGGGASVLYDKCKAMNSYLLRAHERLHVHGGGGGEGAADRHILRTQAGMCKHKNWRIVNLQMEGEKTTKCG